MIFGTLICRFRGHQRGKLINVTPHPVSGFNHTYACPRCKRLTVRKKASGPK